MTVLIAGGGIAGLSLALSCHQVGIPFKLFEAAREMRPLGVGINLQPNAVRELFELGLERMLDEVGIRTADYGLYSSKGHHIWTEPRGIAAGYGWPQFSVHRGRLQMALYDTLIERAGPEAVQTGCRVTGFESGAEGVTLHWGAGQAATGDLLIGADGIHSAIRAQIHPGEGPPNWGGMVLWRGTTRAAPYLSGASMVMIGPLGHRIVAYPISAPDASDGKATINWIAELGRDPDEGFAREDYARAARLADFAPRFQDFRFDWFDAPALIAGAQEVFEYPMVDRDPLPFWQAGRVTLIGDAAHAAYPVGSNGAGAGIIDARKLVAAFLAHGVGTDALAAYEAEMRPVTSRMIEMNRSAGPDRIIDMVEDRTGGAFDRIEDVISAAELAEYAARYKAAAGTGIAQTNDRGPIIAPGARASA